MQSAIGVYDLPGTTGSHSVTGLGFQPQGLLLLAVYSNQAADTLISGVQSSIGATGTTPATTRCELGLGPIEDGETTSAAGRHTQETSCFRLITRAGTELCRGNVSSYDADGFTLDIANASLGSKLIYIAFEGLTNWNGWESLIMNTTTAVTAGFQPDVVLEAGSLVHNLQSDVQPASYISLGASDPSSGTPVNHCMGTASFDNIGTTKTWRRYSNSLIYYAINADDGTSFETGTATGLSADGYTRTSTGATGTAPGRRFLTAAIKHPYTRVTTFTAPTTDSTITRSGFGFTPKFTLLWTVFEDVANTSQRGSDFCVGAANATSQFGHAYRDADNLGTSDAKTRWSQTYVQTDTANARRAVAGNWQSDSYDLTFSNTSGEAYHIIEVVIGDEASAAVELAGDMSVSGTLAGNLSATGPGTEELAGDLVVSGSLAGDVTAVTPGIEELAGDLAVSGSMVGDLLDSQRVSGDLTTAGTLIGNLTVEASGEVQLSGGLSVRGTSAGDVLVLQAAQLAANVQVSGQLWGILTQPAPTGQARVVRWATAPYIRLLRIDKASEA